MSKQTSNAVRFELYAENHRQGTLVVRNLEQNNFFIRKTKELAADEKLMQGFSKKEAEFISTLSERQ